MQDHEAKPRQPIQAQIPLPPEEYQLLVGGPRGVELFSDVGRRLVQFLDYEQMLGPQTTFLDVGCGCGRLARYLVDTPIASYRGFDRHPGMIDWCSKEITTRAPSFIFDFFAIKSLYDDHDD